MPFQLHQSRMKTPPSNHSISAELSWAPHISRLLSARRLWVCECARALTVYPFKNEEMQHKVSRSGEADGESFTENEPFASSRSKRQRKINDNASSRRNRAEWKETYTARLRECYELQLHSCFRPVCGLVSRIFLNCSSRLCDIVVSDIYSFQQRT